VYYNGEVLRTIPHSQEYHNYGQVDQDDYRRTIVILKNNRTDYVPFVYMTMKYCKDDHKISNFQSERLYSRSRGSYSIVVRTLNFS